MENHHEGIVTPEIAKAVHLLTSPYGGAGGCYMIHVFEEALKDKIYDNPELQKDILAAVYQLCEEHEKKAFFPGMKEEISLMTEL